MKRFVFRLESVLRLRRHELDRARRRLAEVEAETTRRRTRVDEARTRLAAGQRLLEADAAAGVDGDRLGLRAQGVILGRLDLGRAERALADLMPVLEAARAAVREAHARVESLDRLRERRAEAHRRENEAIEQAMLEDLALQRRAHRRRQGEATATDAPPAPEEAA